MFSDIPACAGAMMTGFKYKDVALGVNIPSTFPKAMSFAPRPSFHKMGTAYFPEALHLLAKCNSFLGSFIRAWLPSAGSVKAILGTESTFLKKSWRSGKELSAFFARGLDLLSLAFSQAFSRAKNRSFPSGSKSLVTQFALLHPFLIISPSFA